MGILSIHCLTTQKSTATVFGIAFGYSDVMDENRRRMHLLIIKSKAPPTSLSDLEWTLVHATPLDKLSLLTKHTLGYWFCNIDSAGSITALAIDDTRSSPEPYVIIHFDPAGVKVNSTYTTTEPNWWQANISAGFDRGLYLNPLLFDLPHATGQSLVYHTSVIGKWISFSYLDTSSRTMRPLAPWDLSSVFQNENLWGLVFGDEELYVIASGSNSVSFAIFPMDVANSASLSLPPLEVQTYTWSNTRCDFRETANFHSVIGKTLSIFCPTNIKDETAFWPMLLTFNGTHALPPVTVDTWSGRYPYGQFIGVGVEGNEKGPFLILQEMEPPPITSRRLLSGISCNPKSLGAHTRGSLVNITDDYHVLDSGPVALGQAGASTLSTGAIISITIGALAVLALACFVIIRRRRRMALTRRIEDESIQKQPERDDEEMTLQGKAEMDKSSVENDKIAKEQDGASNAIGNQSRSEQTGDTSESPSMQSRVLVLMNEPGLVERSHDNRDDGNPLTVEEWVPKPFDPRIYEQVHTPTTERGVNA